MWYNNIRRFRGTPQSVSRGSAAYGPVAQLGERSVRIREVVGSNPFRSTNTNTVSVMETVFFRLYRKPSVFQAVPIGKEPFRGFAGRLFRVYGMLPGILFGKRIFIEG